MKYRLTCECGRSYPIEPRQAGQTLDCECGKTLQIPTMLKMKRLPEWEEEESAPEPAPVDAKSQTSPETTREAAPQENATPQKADDKSKKAPLMSPKRMGLFIVAGLVFVVGVFFLSRCARRPDPISVNFKRTVYRNDGKDIRRNSSEITEKDFYFYFIPDGNGGIVYADPQRRFPVVINDDVIDKGLSYFGAFTYFQYVKELDFSDNFYDNYNAILTRWKTAIVLWALVAVAGLVVALLALFTKESTKQIGTARGEGWR